jgi:multiple antibiotic resistance protein
MTLLSATTLLVLVMDPLGNVPLFLAALKNVPDRRRWRVVLRELLIALAVLAAFLLAGPVLLEGLHISEPALRISGGIVLFLIALKMVFSPNEEAFAGNRDEEPFIVPLAIPFVAGPSAMATVLLLVSQQPQHKMACLWALLLAWVVTAAVLIVGDLLHRVLGQRGLRAMECLMGMILTTLAVDMSLQGIRQFLEK